MSGIVSLETVADMVKDRHPKIQALTVLIQAIKLAQSKGSFSLKESRLLSDAVDVFEPEVNSQDPGKEEENTEITSSSSDGD
jgi:hypothetical protein